MKNRLTVQKAYVGNERTLVDSEGKVYVPSEGRWFGGGSVPPTPTGPVYERWSDVPAAWLGIGCVYFR